jgi:monothiol glutaredoxin
MPSPADIPAMRDASPAAARERLRAGSLTLVDVRPPEERALASVDLPHAGLEDGGLQRLLALPRDTPLAFLCHHGVRSAQAAEYFRAHGFSDVHNVVGGIDAWSALDPAIPRY